jgi:CBS domain containing-hemolysin-like protein
MDDSILLSVTILLVLLYSIVFLRSHEPCLLLVEHGHPNRLEFLLSLLLQFLLLVIASFVVVETLSKCLGVNTCERIHLIVSRPINYWVHPLLTDTGCHWPQFGLCLLREIHLPRH